MLSFCLVLSTLLGSSQSAYLHPSGQVAVFGNLNLNASVKQNKVFEAQVVDVNTGQLIGKLSQSIKVGNFIRAMKTNQTGQLLAIYTNEAITVWSVVLNKVVSILPKDAPFAFSSHTSEVYVADCCHIRLKNAQGEIVNTYDLPSKTSLLEMETTANDNQLIVQTNDQEILFYEARQNRYIKKLKGDQYQYSESQNRISTLAYSPTGGTVYQYELPSFERTAKINLSTLIRDYLNQRNRTLQKNGSRKYELLGTLATNQAFFINNGSHVFIPTYASKKWYVYLINLASEEIIGRYEIGNAISQIFQIPGKVTLLTKKDRHQWERRKGKWNYETEKLKQGEDFGFENSDYEVKFFGLPQGQQSVVDCQALLADEKNMLALVKWKNQFGKISLGIEPLRVRWFSLNPVVRIESETIAIEGISKGRITGIRHISEATEQDSLRVVFKTIEGGTRTGVEVLLQDQQGNIYYGASAPEWKHIWCKLTVKNPDGTVEVKSGFAVTEYFSRKTLPMAACIGVDFSGSMGKAKARQLDRGMATLVQAKHDEDYMSVMKYDHRVLSSPLMRDKPKLLNEIQAIQYEELAGGTALLDAITLAIQQVKFQDGVTHRIVIILTDGKDTSSRTPLSKVIKNARENQVKIYTIAYGDEVDHELLKNIAHSTQGGYYSVAQAKDFDWIFKDIYTRANTYYNISFQTEQYGQQIQQLKVCPPKSKADSLEVSFDNRLEEQLKQVLAQKPTVRIVNQPQLYKKSNIQAEITVNEARKINREKIADDKLTEAEEQFDTIPLPQFNFLFDKVEIVKATESRMKQVVAFLAQYPKANLVVIGHTDNQGNKSYNQTLSENRARAVGQLITDYGGDAKRLKLIGYGETNPIATNETEAGRAKNRRVEFRVQWN